MQLLRESDYLKAPGRLTEADVEPVLRRDPELVVSWQRYSEDQRCSPAWYLTEPGYSFGQNEWRVGRLDRALRKREWSFDDEYKACAFFVVRFIERLVQVSPGKVPDDLGDLLTRSAGEVGLGRPWRAKEILGGRIASARGPVAPALLEAYGALLDSLGDRFEAGKFLYLSGSQDPAHADAIALFLHRTRNMPASALIGLFPRAVQRAGLGHLPGAVRDALAARGVEATVLQGTSPVDRRRSLDSWRSRLALWAVLALIAGLAISALVGMGVIARAVLRAVW